MMKILITFICAIIVLISGCVTKGGKKLGGGSVGRVIRPLSPTEFNRSAEFNPIVSKPTSPAIKAKPIKTPPKSPPLNSVPANPTPEVKSPPVKVKPFKPTISESPNLPALPKKEVKTKLKINVAPISPNTGNNEETIVENGTDLGIIDESKDNEMETNWTNLLIFYGILGVIVLLTWLFLDKRVSWWRKQTTEKPVRKTPIKAPRKTKKKKVANKGQRKSTLAAKKKPKKKPKKKS